MDTSVSYSVQSFMTCGISVFGAMLVVTAVTPTIIVAIALLSIVYYRVQVRTPQLSCVFWKHLAAVSVRRRAAGGGRQEKCGGGAWRVVVLRDLGTEWYRGSMAKGGSVLCLMLKQQQTIVYYA